MAMVIEKSGRRDKPFLSTAENCKKEGCGVSRYLADIKTNRWPSFKKFHS
jgi:hypothetical protein